MVKLWKICLKINILLRLSADLPKRPNIGRVFDYQPSLHIHYPWTGLKCSNRHRSKSIWVTSLFFCQNDSPTSDSFWQKNRLVTHILFDLCLFEHFSPVASFEQQSIALQSDCRNVLWWFYIKIWTKNYWSLSCWRKRILKTKNTKINLKIFRKISYYLSHLNSTHDMVSYTIRTCGTNNIFKRFVRM